jgi:pilus assembly protein Flp/PilA
MVWQNGAPSLQTGPGRDKTMIKNFLKSEEGVTLVEYGLLVGLISVVAIAAITNVGKAVNTLFTYVAERLQNVADNAN